ncbi:MAG: hypothetical protein ABI432_10615 [Flavobacteriales bacterium]
MSNLLRKSQQNDAASGILIANGLYATSIHCSYYRCLQYMLHLHPHELPRGQPDDRTQGTHNVLIAIIGQKLREKDTTASVNFNNEIQKLKKLRTQADYQEPMFDASTSREAQRMASGIVQLFQKVLGS